MGIIGDIFQGQVVLKYKADTEQAKIALRELSGEQKKNAQQAVQGIEDQLKAHERLAAKITIGMGIAAGAIAIGVSSFKAYENQVRLSTASAGADMGALRSASHGLMTDIELMGVAAEGMNGRFKLTSAEMSTVLEAAVALERRGMGPLAEITKKLGDAMRKGEIDPLKDLGVSYDETLAKYDKRAAVLKSLGALSREAAAGTEEETEAIRRQSIAAENYYDRAKSWFGGIVHDSVAGIGMILDAGSDADARLRYQAPVLYQLLGLKGMTNLAILQGQLAGLAARESNAAAEAARRRAEDAAYVDYLRGARMDAQRAAIQKQKDDFAARGAANRRGSGGGGYSLNAAEGGGMVNFRTSAAEQIDRIIEEMAAAKLAELNFGALGTEASDALAGAAGGKRGPRRDAAGFAVGKGGTAYGVSSADKSGPSFMEKMLGPVDQFDAYATAWGGFQNAVTAGYEALVTGSESFGKAAKRVIGQTIMAEGSHMLVLALREGAQAIASLAGGNFAAAGTHGLAAAKFGAGAALAGVVAHSLGAGGSTASAGAGASASGVSTSGVSNDNAPRNTNIVLGHGWDDETNRQRAARFARAQRQASSYEGAPVGVVYG